MAERKISQKKPVYRLPGRIVNENGKAISVHQRERKALRITVARTLFLCVSARHGCTQPRSSV